MTLLNYICNVLPLARNSGDFTDGQITQLEKRPDKVGSYSKRLACNRNCKIGIAVILFLTVVGAATYVAISYTNQGIKLLLSNYCFYLTSVYNYYLLGTISKYSFNFIYFM